MHFRRYTIDVYAINFLSLSVTRGVEHLLKCITYIISSIIFICACLMRSIKIKDENTYYPSKNIHGSTLISTISSFS